MAGQHKFGAQNLWCAADLAEQCAEVVVKDGQGLIGGVGADEGGPAQSFHNRVQMAGGAVRVEVSSRRDRHAHRTVEQSICAHAREQRTGRPAMKTVAATIQIDAPPAKVWAVLTDLSAYPRWNPLFPEAFGPIAIGSRLTLKTVQPNGRTMTIKPKILAVEPNAELRWRARPTRRHRRRALLHPRPRRRRHPARAERDVPRPARALLQQDPRRRRVQLPGTQQRPESTRRSPVSHHQRAQWATTARSRFPATVGASMA